MGPKKKGGNQAPAAPEQAPGVSVVATDHYGATAKATRSFAPGEVVVEENPTLIIPRQGQDEALDASYGELENMEREFGVPEGTFACVASAERYHTADEIRELIADLYTPIGDVMVANKAELKLAAALVAPGVLERVLGRKDSGSCQWRRFFKGWVDDTQLKALEMVKFTHAVRVNTHSDDKRGFSGVFPVASKFAHSCAASTFWFLKLSEGMPATGFIPANLQRQARVVHVALRKIEAGELLTFGYQGTGLNCLTHTLQRRENLHELNFVCNCPRCSTFDKGTETCRSLPCPVAREESPRSKAAATATITLRPDHGGWCSSAHGLLPPQAAAVALKFETAIVELMMKLFFVSRNAPADTRQAETEQLLNKLGDIGDVLRHAQDGLSLRWLLADAIVNELGPQHYASAVSFCALLRCVLLAADQIAQGGKGDFVPFLARETSMRGSDPKQGSAWLALLFRRAVQTHRWFETNAKESAQHTKYLCLFLEVEKMLGVETVRERLVYRRYLGHVDPSQQLPGGGEEGQPAAPTRVSISSREVTDEEREGAEMQLTLLRRFATEVTTQARPFLEKQFREFTPTILSFDALLS